MPPAAPSDRPSTSDEAHVEVVVPRRQPPPHLGNAYRNVFVETAALEVVITLPVDDGAAPGGVAGATTRAVGPDPKARVLPAPAARVPAVPAQRVAPPAAPELRATPPLAPEPRGSGPGPSTGGAGEAPQLHLSRRSLAGLVALAGLGALALVVLGALVLVGVLLAVGAIDL